MAISGRACSALAAVACASIFWRCCCMLLAGCTYVIAPLCCWVCLPCSADLVITHALEWPSLTVQWLPVRAAAACSTDSAAARRRAAAGRRAAVPHCSCCTLILWAECVVCMPADALPCPKPPHPSLGRRQLKEEKTDAGYSKQQLILGTHTSEGEQNYLMRAEVQLPLEETETDGRCAPARVSALRRWGRRCAWGCCCVCWCRGGVAQVCRDALEWLVAGRHQQWPEPCCCCCSGLPCEQGIR